MDMNAGCITMRNISLCTNASPLTLNLLTTTIVAPLVVLANGRWDLIRRLTG